MAHLATKRPDVADTAILSPTLPAAAIEAESTRPTASLVAGDSIELAAPLQHRAYGSDFWLAYVSNFLTMASVAMLVRYADFVSLLGGTERQLGWIVGVGSVGSMSMRLMQGRGIDRIGTRPIWISSLVVLVISLLANLLVQDSYGVLIFVLRCLTASSTAGALTAAMTFVSRKAPPERMAEMIGTLGTAGFFGMFVGPILGDIVCGTDGVSRREIDVLFLIAGGLIAAAALFALFASWNDLPPAPRRSIPVLSVIRRYQPGALLMMATISGAGLNLLFTFLRPFAKTLDIPTVWLFFTVYSMSALLGRVVSRRWPERLGNYVCTILGTLLLVSAMLLLMPVKQTWHMIPAAITLGFAHALLFPAVIAGISTAFPARHRGVGTTLALMLFDVGTLVGAPLAGTILHFSIQWQLPAYLVMFLSMGLLFSAALMLYMFLERRHFGDFAKLTGALRRQFSSR